MKILADELKRLEGLAKQNDPQALMKLGIYYASKMVCTQDYLALTMLRQAAQHGLKDAKFWYGFMLSNGRGTHENIKEAKKLYNQASRQGQVDASASLAFRQKGVNRKTCEQFLRNPELRVLDLANLSLGDSGLALLCEYLPDSSVRKIHLKNNGITSNGIFRLAEVLPKTQIKVCDLWHNNIDCEGLVALAAVAHESKLRILDLAENQISDKGVAAFSANPPPLLHTLHLGDNKLTEASGEALRDLILRTPTLRIIDLGRNKLGVNGAVNVSEGLARSRLEILDLAANGIGDIGFVTVMRAAHQSRLASLDVKLNGITSNGMLAIADIFADCALTALNLRNNNIGPEGATIFTRFPETLELINLRSNMVGNTGLAYIAAGLASSALHTLNVASNGIDHSGLRILMACSTLSRLKTLNLSGNNLTSIDEPYLLLGKHCNIEDLDVSGSSFDLDAVNDLIERFSELSLQRLNLLNTLPCTVDQSQVSQPKSEDLTLMLWHQQKQERRQRVNKDIVHHRDFSVAVNADTTMAMIEDQIRELLGSQFRMVKTISEISSTSYAEALPVVREKLDMSPEQKNQVFRISFVADDKPLDKQTIMELSAAIYQAVHENKEGYFLKVK